MLKGKFQERTVELKWAQEPSVTLQFWFRSEMAQTSEQCFKITTKDTPNFKKMFGSQVQRPFSPSSTSERQGKKLWAVPRSIYQVI